MQKFREIARFFDLGLLYFQHNFLKLTHFFKKHLSSHCVKKHFNRIFYTTTTIFMKILIWLTSLKYFTLLISFSTILWSISCDNSFPRCILLLCNFLKNVTTFPYEIIHLLLSDLPHYTSFFNFFMHFSTICRAFI